MRLENIVCLISIMLVVLVVLIVLIVPIVLVITNILSHVHTLTFCGDHSSFMGLASTPRWAPIFNLFLRSSGVVICKSDLSFSFGGDLEGIPTLKLKLRSIQI